MRRRGFLVGASSVLFVPQMSVGATSEPIAISGDRYRMGTQEFILSDIRAPSAYVLGGGQEPFFAQAKAHLQGFMDMTKIEIEDAAPNTRWNARVVKAHRLGSEISLQEQMVTAGSARVDPQTDDHIFIEHLLERERIARANGKGLWALQDYKIVNAQTANAAIGAYHLVEGRVVTANATRSRFYLNFGDDYRTDFTASAKSKFYRRWLRDSFDLESLESAKIRVRGLVLDINGPSIDLTHRHQIEVI